MKLDLDALRTLDAIETHGSFARAAAALHRVPSAVTYTVRKLEQQLDVTLFDRSGHRAVLTATGHLLLQQGRELLLQAENLEERVRRSGQGWETRLVIAVDEILPLERLFPLILRFDALRSGTQLQLTQEIFGGTWDALIDHRADLVVGAAGDPPAGYGFGSRQLLEVPFVFAMTPDHPLASLPEPLPVSQIARYRAVVAADSSRRLPARSGGFQAGQPVLVVPGVAAKLAAQVSGLGVGFLPAFLAQPSVEAGTLVTREVETPRPPAQLNLAWRSGENGRALSWFRGEVLRHAPQLTP
ncbi:LysR family transcriptional regulator [Flagellatimonas centrodinii]|uniref:LysR family transcriptional regulator n=1 Tax=Flagellatimonas centrodinii TaxID=2806210 RepID=UPI001FEE8D84|nr:LysR family transcriptional regulator [Flagellatimonas centrodinii]ULQ45128.1 LysR family transcriptional regulator [Flagellatimonas centrodinii]